MNLSYSLLLLLCYGLFHNIVSGQEQVVIVAPTGTSNGQNGITFNLRANSASRVRISKLVTEMGDATGNTDLSVWTGPEITSSFASNYVVDPTWSQVHAETNVAYSLSELSITLSTPIEVSPGQVTGVAILSSKMVRYYTDANAVVLETNGTGLTVITGGHAGWGITTTNQLVYNPREFSGKVIYTLVPLGPTAAPTDAPTAVLTTLPRNFNSSVSVQATGTSNSHFGITFNVRADAAMHVTIYRLTTAMAVTTGNTDVSVWTAPEISTSKPPQVATTYWTQVHFATNMLFSNGELVLDLNTPIVLSPEQTLGVAIVSSQQVRYYTDLDTAVLETSGPGITVITGGHAGWGITSSQIPLYNPREYQGNLSYSAVTSGVSTPSKTPTGAPSMTPTPTPTSQPTTRAPTVSSGHEVSVNLEVEQSNDSGINSQYGITFNLQAAAGASVTIRRLSTAMVTGSGTTSVNVWIGAEITAATRPPMVGTGTYWTQVHAATGVSYSSNLLDIALDLPFQLSDGETVGLAIVCSQEVRYYTDKNSVLKQTSGPALTVFTGGQAGWGLSTHGALNNNPREFKGAVGYTYIVGSGWPTPAPNSPPSRFPTREPSVTPPTRSPTVLPTHHPTGSPTALPTRSPTREPTEAPSLPPTPFPSARGSGASAVFPYNAGPLSNTNSAQSNVAVACLRSCPGQMLTFDTCNADSAGDTYLRLYSSAGDLLVYNDDFSCSYGNTKSRLVFQHSASSPCETVCLHIGCYGISSCTAVVRLDTSTFIAPSQAPTKLPTLAPQAGPFPYTTAYLTSTDSARVDYEEACVSLCGGDVATFDSCNSGSTGDTFLRLFYGASQVADDDDACSERRSRIRYTVPSGLGCGEYCLRMGCYSSNACRLHVTFSAVPGASGRPSPSPTLRPTARPTTARPTAIPTVHPTRRPTASPSPRPTTRPTVPVGSEVLAFDAEVEFSGMQADDVNALPELQEALEVAAATSMGIDAAYVAFVSATAAHTRRRTWSPMSLFRITRVLPTSGCVVTTKVDVPVMLVSGGTDAVSAYNALSSSLTTQASSGALLNNLVAAANTTGSASYVASVTVGTVQSGSMQTYSTTGTPTSAPTEAPPSKSFMSWLRQQPVGMLAGAGVGIFVLLLCGGCLGYNYYLRVEFERMINEESVERMGDGHRGAAEHELPSYSVAVSAPPLCVALPVPAPPLGGAVVAYGDDAAAAKLGQEYDSASRRDTYMYDGNGGGGGHGSAAGSHNDGIVEEVRPCAPPADLRHNLERSDFHSSSSDPNNEAPPPPPPYGAHDGGYSANKASSRPRDGEEQRVEIDDGGRDGERCGELYELERGELYELEEREP